MREIFDLASSVPNAGRDYFSCGDRREPIQIVGCCYFALLLLLFLRFDLSFDFGRDFDVRGLLFRRDLCARNCDGCRGFWDRIFVA